MEFLRLNVIAFFLIISFGVFAQNKEQVITAFEKSYNFEKIGEYNNAISVIKKAYDANSYEINLRLGWLHYSSGLFTESASYYQKAIALMPVSIEAKFGLVYPLAALNKWDNVMKIYLDILKLDPANTVTNYKLGLIYYGKEDYQNANKYFKKVVNLYPFDYDALIMYAWSNKRLGKTRESKVLFNKVLMISPNDASALEGLK